MIDTTVISNLCSKHKTPFYVYFESCIKENYEKLHNTFLKKYSKSQIAYSIKNCFIPKIINSLEQYKPLYEITSLGEMKLLKKMQIELDRSIYTNIYKSEESLRFALMNNVGFYAIDSYSDLKHLETVSKELDKKANVLIRVNPALNIKDTIFASAVPWSKTGVEMCTGYIDCAENLLIKASESDNFNLAGLHGHLGSQVTNIEYYREFTESIVKFYADMENKYNFNMNMLDFGGGYPIKYKDNESISSIEEIANTIISCIKNYGINPNLVIESGRFISSDAGILVTKVVGTKNSPYVGKIVIVDASMYNHLLDSILVDWYFEIYKLNNITNKEKLEEVHIVGGTNDALDHLDPPTNDLCPWCNKEIPRTRKRKLPQIDEGDILIIKNAGAYTTCFNNNYCLLPKPEVLMITDGGEIIQIRKCEDINNIFSLFTFGM